MFKKVVIKEEESDNFVNPECHGDVKMTAENSIIYSDLLTMDLKSEDHETTSIEVEKILPIETIYVPDVSAFVKLYFC